MKTDSKLKTFILELIQFYLRNYLKNTKNHSICHWPWYVNIQLYTVLRNFENIFKLYNPIYNINHEHGNHEHIKHIKNIYLGKDNFGFLKYERSF